MALGAIHFLNWFYSFSLKNLPLICFCKFFYHKKFVWKIQVNPTWLETWLTHNSIDPFENDQFLTCNLINSTRPTRLPQVGSGWVCAQPETDLILLSGRTMDLLPIDNIYGSNRVEFFMGQLDFGKNWVNSGRQMFIDEIHWPPPNLDKNCTIFTKFGQISWDLHRIYVDLT